MFYQQNVDQNLLHKLQQTTSPPYLKMLFPREDCGGLAFDRQDNIYVTWHEFNIYVFVTFAYTALHPTSS